MSNCYIRLCFSIFCCIGFKVNLTAQDSFAQTATVKVIRVFDGDTIEAEENGKVYRIRLNGIDAPERGQEFFEESKQVLTQLVANPVILIEKKGKDAYGRVIATLYRFSDCLNINYEIVRQGLAWHYARYSTDVYLAKLEMQARDHQIGLWSLFHYVQPWEFRKNK